MTINELDQGIRNLIASQPMIVSGVNGSIIGGINSIIDAYRNLSFRVQSYPCQDVLKFGLANEIAKMESTFCNMAFQVLQERGINLMLYIPRSGAGFAPMQSGYGMINTAVDPSVMLGQMSYNAPMAQPSPMMQMSGMANPMMRGGGQAFPQMQQNIMNTKTFQPTGAPRAAAPTYPGYNTQPVKLEPTPSAPPKTYAPPQSKIKEVPKAPTMNTIEKAQPAPVPVAEAPQKKSGPSAAEILMGAAAPSENSNAKGRDYLLELLKK